MRLKLFIILLLLSSIQLSSCKNDEREINEENEDLKAMLEEPGVFGLNGTGKDHGDNYGTVVPTCEADDCIKKFADSMANHGIVPGLPRDTNLLVKRTLTLTDYEYFRGYEVLDFLRKAQKLRGKWYELGTVKKKRLCVRVEFGIYTPEYCAKRGDPSKVGRIAVFLCSRAWTEDPITHKIRFFDVEDPGDPQSFDFGGIHP
jgi:hypothetical protein